MSKKYRFSRPFLQFMPHIFDWTLIWKYAGFLITLRQFYRCLWRKFKAVCLGSLSWYRLNVFWIPSFWEDIFKFSFRIFIYLYWSILFLMKTKFPLPEAGKHVQTIMAPPPCLIVRNRFSDWALHWAFSAQLFDYQAQIC